MMTILKDCTTCRHHSKTTRPKVVDATGFDDQIEFADENETLYSCRAPQGPFAGREVGTVAVSCPSFEQPQSGAARLAELDRMIAERNKRTRGAE